jgi:hypothetical protein
VGDALSVASILPLEVHGMGLTSLADKSAQACCWEEGGETWLRHPLGTVVSPLCDVSQTGRDATFLHRPEIGHPLVVALEKVSRLRGGFIRHHQAAYPWTRGRHLS